MLQCVAVCCSVLQCVAVCCCEHAIACHACDCILFCSVLQCVAACCSVLHCFAAGNKLRVMHMTVSCHEQVCGGMKRPQLIATHTATPTLHHAAMHRLRQRAAPKKKCNKQTATRTTTTHTLQHADCNTLQHTGCSGIWHRRNSRGKQAFAYGMRPRLTATLTQQHAATHGKTRQHTATHGNTLPTHCNTLQYIALQHIATHCNTLQPIATHCNPLQHIATHCNTLQHTATHCNTLQHIATHCNTPQHIVNTATPINLYSLTPPQHTPETVP